jgi:hypothetical protein
MMKKCLYCGEFVNTANDDYQKVGKKIVCVFCYEENADEIDNSENLSEDDFDEDSEDLQ